MERARELESLETKETEDSLSMAQIFGSILASFCGVQSSRNRKRDFQSGKARQFIAAGIILTGVWYLTIYLVVTLVVHKAG